MTLIRPGPARKRPATIVIAPGAASLPPCLDDVG